MAELTNNQLSPEVVFGPKAGSKSCKLPSKDTGVSSQIPNCPKCGSLKYGGMANVRFIVRRFSVGYAKLVDSVSLIPASLNLLGNDGEASATNWREQTNKKPIGYIIFLPNMRIGDEKFGTGTTVKADSGEKN